LTQLGAPKGDAKITGYDYVFCKSDGGRPERGGLEAETFPEALLEFGSTGFGNDGALFCGAALVAVRKNGSVRVAE
jgi:hypothetical protein